MEVLVFLLIGILFAISGSNKKKRGQQPNGRPVAPRPVQPAQPVAPQRPVNVTAGRDFLKDLMKAVEDSTEAMLEGKPAPKPVTTPVVQPVSAAQPIAPAAQLAAPLYAQGSGLEDDEGCVGGSMAHVHTEGETRAEHREHVERLKKREAEERQAEEALWDSAALNRQRLRQAVVMAEVLGKPRALKPRAGRYVG